MKTNKQKIKYLQNYFKSYPTQLGYEKYSDKTIILDTLYGLGVALDDKYSYAQGFAEFKKLLLKHLSEDAA